MTEYGYDALGRLIWVDEQESADVHHVTRYAYDAAGRKIAQREGLPAQPLDNSTESLYSEAEGGRLTVYTYDEDGRFTSITTPDGGTERYTYDDAGRMTEKVLANGRRMTYVYDVAGRLVSMTGTDTSGSITHVTTYDAQGRVRDKQDENGATRYAYDQDGNILAESRIEGGKLISQNRYTYTVDGRQERYRLFICALTVPASPADGWELSAVDAAYAADVSLLRQDLAYTYDNQARLVCAEDGVSGSVTRYTYDSEGALAEKRAAQRTNGVETPIYRQEYTYNLAGLITGIREFAGSDTAPCKVDTLTYRRDGNLVRKVSGDTTVEYAYDALGRLAAETEFSIGTQVRRDVYTYTAAGDRRTKTTTTGEDGTQRVSYGYDAGGRLISEDWAQKGAGESYDPLPEKAVTYTYDASGNLLTKTVGSGDDRVCVAAYTYDSLNRLSGAVSASVREMPDLMDAGGVTLQQVKTQTVAFRYDANAQRIGKTVTLGYAADGEDAALTAEVRHIVNDTAAAYDLIAQDGATRESSYLFGTKGADGAAQFEALYTGDTLYAAVSDAHTDVVGLRTVSGDTVEYAYDAFGNELSAAETAVYNPYRYVGQYYDSETGLYYLRARYYDPETGRFTQRDSYQGEVNNPQSLNLYAYATNNPVRFLDRFGHMNYLTQTGTLFRGILAGVVSEIAGLFNIQGYIDMAKAIFSGQLNLKTLFAGLADNHYIYVLTHMQVLNPFKRASNKDVTAMGKHIGGIVYDIASVLIGVAAAKVLSILKTTRIGAKIASTLSKVKGKISSSLSKAKCKIQTKITHTMRCFTAGTPVLLPDGMKPIEEIRKGDWVWSVAPETGDPELKQVEDVFVNETDEIVHVRYGDTEIDATPTHPFYTPDRGWVSAVNLRAGDRLQLVNGEYVTVEQVQHEILESPVKVYNFEVEGFHTYYVGNNSVLVHNTCGKKPTSPNQMQKQVERGQAPRTVVRVDNPKDSGQLPHIHFSDGTAMNIDGSIHDAMNGRHTLTNSERIWIFDNGWGG